MKVLDFMVMILFELTTAVDFTVLTFFFLQSRYSNQNIYELTLPPQATHLAPDDEGGGGWHCGMNIGRMCLGVGEFTQRHRSGDTARPPALRENANTPHLQLCIV